MYFSRLCVLFLFLFLSAESSLAQCQIYYSSNSTSFFPEIDSGIFRVDLDGSNPEALIQDRTHRSLAYGAQTSTVYWVEGSQIFSASLERFLAGGFTEDEISDAALSIDVVGGIRDLAVNESGNELFWTNFGLTSISRGNIATGEVDVVYQGAGLASVIDNLQVDAQNQKLI